MLSPPSRPGPNSLDSGDSGMVPSPPSQPEIESTKTDPPEWDSSDRSTPEVERVDYGFDTDEAADDIPSFHGITEVTMMSMIA